MNNVFYIISFMLEIILSLWITMKCSAEERDIRIVELDRYFVVIPENRFPKN